MVLGKLPVLGRPANLNNIGAGPSALAVGAGWGCLDIFLSSITSLFFLPLSGRWPDMAVKRNNQPNKIHYYYAFFRGVAF